MPSYKTTVIEQLFMSRWDAASQMLSRDHVTLEEVSLGIHDYNETHRPTKLISTRNPANFFKDIARNRRRANANWPESVFRAGYTAVQETGGNACFRFVRLQPGSETPFPEKVFSAPGPQVQRFEIQSVSLPLASRKLGRNDEPWLIQVLVRLKVIESHFAICSSLYVVQIDHLQTNVKLGRNEVDALFLAAIQPPGQHEYEALICCEAKSKREDLIESQIIGQVQSVARMRGVEQPAIVPIAVKVIGHSQVHVIEFREVNKAEADTLGMLEIVSEAVYTLKPAVPGI